MLYSFTKLESRRRGKYLSQKICSTLVICFLVIKPPIPHGEFPPRKYSGKIKLEGLRSLQVAPIRSTMTEICLESERGYILKKYFRLGRGT